MKTSIMQPYFFPYIGYWQLIFNSDIWVFFDSPQYNKRSWMNRNKILHSNPESEFQYINVPIKKHNKGEIIKNVQINNNEQWQIKLYGQLSVYKRIKAPYYNNVINLIESILQDEESYFTPLSIKISVAVASYLGLRLEYKISSELDIDYSQVNKPDDWALLITKHLGGNQYINPHGGMDIFSSDKYSKNGIELLFLKPILKEYKQSLRKFNPGLSIIDILMFNSKEEVVSILKNDFELIKK